MAEHERDQAEQRERITAVMDAVENYDLKSSSSWQKLNELSDETIVDAIQVDPAGVTVTFENRFRGIANVYVALSYKSDKGNFVTTEGLMGEFSGHFDSERHPVIEDLKVNLAPLLAA